MNDKLENLKEIEYYTNFNTVGEYVVKWKKAKPENKDLILMYDSLTQVGFYVNELLTNQRLRNEIVSEHRSDKIRAVNRARKAESKLEELQKKYKELKTQKALGL
tara:strand:- start:321 stop:635 length:315 start_codon:yes stop_codon:yes gene_type:complete